MSQSKFLLEQMINFKSLNFSSGSFFTFHRLRNLPSSYYVRKIIVAKWNMGFVFLPHAPGTRNFFAGFTRFEARKAMVNAKKSGKIFLRANMEQLCWKEPFTLLRNNLGISHFLLAFLLLLLLFRQVFVLPFAFRPLAYTPRAAAGIVFFVLLFILPQRFCVFFHAKCGHFASFV